MAFALLAISRGRDQRTAPLRLYIRRSALLSLHQWFERRIGLVHSQYSPSRPSLEGLKGGVNLPKEWCQLMWPPQVIGHLFRERKDPHRSTLPALCLMLFAVPHKRKGEVVTKGATEHSCRKVPAVIAIRQDYGVIRNDDHVRQFSS